MMSGANFNQYTLVKYKEVINFSHRNKILYTYL